MSPWGYHPLDVCQITHLGSKFSCDRDLCFVIIDDGAANRRTWGLRSTIVGSPVRLLIVKTESRASQTSFNFASHAAHYQMTAPIYLAPAEVGRGKRTRHASVHAGTGWCTYGCSRLNGSCTAVETKREHLVMLDRLFLCAALSDGAHGASHID